MGKRSAFTRVLEHVLPVRKEGVVYPAWVPFFGWLELQPDTAAMLGLKVRYRWKVLMLEWFNQGFMIAALKIERSGDYA